MTLSEKTPSGHPFGRPGRGPWPTSPELSPLLTCLPASLILRLHLTVMSPAIRQNADRSVLLAPHEPNVSGFNLLASKGYQRLRHVLSVIYCTGLEA
jgi:hypothetical protein